ncbi:M56 family metallopeptidase [Actinospica sp.]|jgi:Zn-dependent protease with chaperone function|uniref:M56 family metallopeptidase n=1 Tax=Actinospica sp. TaxID=1872142 RepID=UPI002C48EADA|nr:M56 family metallopeptidase [Actinospica sp.]HWG28701.1 M56 family metallopeptidase [Actinospica sp.]
MRVLILLSLLFPLAAGPLARAVSARVQPQLATWLMAGGALLLAGTSCGALGLLVLSPLVRMTWLARLGHWSSSIVVGAGLPGGWTSLVAAIALGAALLAAAAFAVRRGRALANAWQHAQSLPGRAELVVTGDAAADAYAVPGRPGRIVVSTGMLGVLDDRGRAALLAHERAHLTGRHHWFTAVARLAAAANPLVRPLASAVEYSVERWADESAAAAVGDRQLVARAIASAALAAKATKAGTGTAIAGALGMVDSETCARVSGRRRMAGLDESGQRRLGWFRRHDDRPGTGTAQRRFGQQAEHDEQTVGAPGRRRFEWRGGHDDQPGTGTAQQRLGQQAEYGEQTVAAAGRRRFARRGGHDEQTVGAAGRRRFGWGAGRDDQLAGAGPVPRRVAALLTSAPTPRRGLPTLTATLLFLGAVAICALVAADHLQDLLSLAHATAERSMG